MQVKNQTNYYRLELGTQGYSTPLAIDYVQLNEMGYLLQYDMSSKTVNIFFDTTNNETMN